MLHLPQVISKVLQPYASAQHLYIAYSGGVDSHVLLHLCAQIKTLSGHLTAVHVHHGLQDSADDWAQHCADTARQLDVNFVLQRVNAQPSTGASPEEVARNARYLVLSSLLNENDLLLIAQHRQDQYESILLQMLRGAGLAGLSGMLAQTQLGKGTLLRPLLDVSKQSIDEYASRHQLHWVEDSSNQCDDFDRNYLRNQISPLIKARWPSADKTISRAGKHCADAAKFIQESSETLFLSLYCSEQRSLSISGLLEYDRYSQQLILRHWFQALKLRLPSTKIIGQILDTVITAREDANPRLQYQQGAVRRYRSRLYWQKQVPDIDHSVSFPWPADQTKIDLPDNSILTTSSTNQPGISSEIWRSAEIRVAYRQGGETMRLPGRSGSHSLKKLFQEAGVPPWQRVDMPLILLDGQLAAVADKWVSSNFFRPAGCDNIRLQWQSVGRVSRQA